VWSMPIIQIMNEHLSNKIAAGEVVERPASVVKELVENSIDAGSTIIEVVVQEGGLGSIKVADNGRGMDREDASLAFERHATSKLKTDRDLFQILTLGFRGEALPSIAAVSHVSLQTWDGEAETGTHVMIQGGKIKETQDAPLRKGTVIEVKALFYNTPARYKYLKSIHTELSHTSDYMNRLALAHPKISFKLIHNGKTLLATSGNGQHLGVISAIYGYSTAKQMISFQASHIDFEVEGYLGKPEITRSNRQYMSVIINGRYIKNYALNQAITRAYHTLLPVHRFPVVILSLKMDASLLDINVHPAKLEARFSKENELIEWLEQEIVQALHREQLIPQPLQAQKKEKQTNVQQTINLQLPDSIMSQEPSPRSYQESVKESTEHFIASGKEDVQAGRERQELHDIQENQEAREAQEAQEAQVPKDTQEETLGKTEGIRNDPIEQSFEEPNKGIPLLFPLAQLHGTYILAQNENGLYMIDQHAAQERIWYERFYKKLNHPLRENQELLISIVLEFTSGEYTLIKENIDLLEGAGLFLEEFGHHSYRVSSHPQWFPAGEEEDLIRDMIQYIIERKGKVEWIRFREKVAILMSCKQAIKANRYLTKPEMEALLEELRLSSNPYTCPHGRPITVLVSKYDIEKMFKRVM
jgi:DNA mismatch repair protein MutL